MVNKNKHSVPKWVLRLEPGQWRLVLLYRKVHEINKIQAKRHLSKCNNVESLECKCYEDDGMDLDESEGEETESDGEIDGMITV